MGGLAFCWKRGEWSYVFCACVVVYSIVFSFWESRGRWSGRVGFVNIAVGRLRRGGRSWLGSCQAGGECGDGLASIGWCEGFGSAILLRMVGCGSV